MMMALLQHGLHIAPEKTMPGLEGEVAIPQHASPIWERRFRDLLENVHLIAIMLDNEGCIKFCNPYLLQLSGWEPQAVLAGNWFNLFIPAEEREAIRLLFTAGVREERFPEHHKNAIITRGGERRMIRWHNTVLRDPDGRITGCASIGEDITETILLEEQYRHAQKLESVGRLAGGIAHDFNNLLTVINGYSDLILSTADQSSKMTDWLMEIRKAGAQATELTRQLLAFSRRQPVNLRPIDLNRVVADQAEMLRRLVGEDIQIEISSAPGAGVVMADLTQVQQILLNLAVNARDAMPQGGNLIFETSTADSIDAACAAMFPDAAPGQYLVLTVSDTGVGMTQEVRAQAFDPFFTTKPEGQGTGLGLSTVYGIVRQYGGWISVQSEPGAGTSFRIGFPRVDVPAFSVPAVANSKSGSGSETILLVEDRNEVRCFVAAVLGRYGYRVLEAADAAEALLISSQHPEPADLILTDIVMPRMSGRELVQRLAPLYPEMRVLYMSGYTDAATTKHGTDAGNRTAYIAKPFTPEALARKVRSVLDSSSVSMAKDPRSNRLIQGE